MQKPYAPACDRNQMVILEKLLPVFLQCHNVLEIGSGTGQHAVHFAQALPQIKWQCSDLEENIDGINLWINDSQLTNLNKPITLNAQAAWPENLDNQFDGVFTANTLHIMSAQAVESLFIRLRRVIKPAGHLFIYGPFNENGQFTSESNAQFDQWLKARNSESGIRDLEEITRIASLQSYKIHTVHELPSNNKLLHFIC